MRGFQKKCWLVFAVLLGAMAGGAQAGPTITYIVKGSIRGTLTTNVGVTGLTDVLFTITGTGATPSAVVAEPNGIDPPINFTNITTTTAFSLAGIGNGTFTDAGFWYTNHSYNATSIAGFALENATKYALTNGSATVLGTLTDDFFNNDYKLATAYGPKSGDGFYYGLIPGNETIAHETSLGSLLITSITPDSVTTFQSILVDDIVTNVPEPGSMALMSLSLLGLLMVRRRKIA